MNKHIDCEEQEDLQPTVKLHQRSIGTIYDAYIHEIGAPEMYADLFYVLDTAGEDDIIKLTINSPGGRLDSSLQLYNAIQSANCPVIANVVGLACSGGSIVMLACNEWNVMKNARIMVHAASGGVVGKSHEIQASVEFDKKWDALVFSDIYKGFLTDKEITEVLAGRDIWLTGEETSVRLQNFIAYKDKEFKKQMKGGKK